MISEEEYNRQLALNSESSLIAIDYYNKDNFQEAIRYFRKAIGDSKDLILTNTYTNLGISYIRINDFENALESFLACEKYLKYSKAPEQLLVLNHIADCYLELGKLKEAESYYLRVMFIDPDNQKGIYGLMRIKSKEREAEENEIWKGFEFSKFSLEISLIDLNQTYILNVFGKNDAKIINHEKGRFSLSDDSVKLVTTDGSGDYVEFTSDGPGINAKYYVMGGDLIVNESCTLIEARNVLGNVSLSYEVYDDDN